jgi:hypothetical protein
MSDRSISAICCIHTLTFASLSCLPEKWLLVLLPQVHSTLNVISVWKLIKYSKTLDVVGFFQLQQVAVQGIWIAGDIHHILKLFQQCRSVRITACTQR